MKNSVPRVLLLLALTSLLAFATMPIGCSGPVDNEKTGDAGEKPDQGGKTDKKLVEKGGSDDKSDDAGTETTPEKGDSGTPESGPEKDDGGNNPDNGDDCAPGCQTCIKLALGSRCSIGTPEDPKPKCPTGLACVENGIGDRGYCYQTCKSNADCTRKGQTCRLQGNDTACDQRKEGDTPCICGSGNTQGEVCDYSRQIFCATDHVCLISDENRTAGNCVKRCSSTADCATGLSCRGGNCREPVCSGPRDYKEKCLASTSESCSKDLACSDGFCFKTCKTKADCDKNDTCELIAFGQPRLCKPKPVVTKEGESCSPFKPCDGSKGLVCLSSGREFPAVCVKLCDPNKKDSCSATQECREATVGGKRINLCQNKVKVNDRCDNFGICPSNEALCVAISETAAYCFKVCNRKDVKKDPERGNTDCGGGINTCNALRSEVEIDGKKYNGICRYPKSLAKVGDSCISGIPKDGVDCADVKGKSIRCVSIGGQATCVEECDPCKSTKNASGDWTNPACSECAALSYSNGNYAFSVCQAAAGGGPAPKDPNVKYDQEAGEFCDVEGRSCKDGLLCVRFSGNNTRAVCLNKCDPGQGGQANPTCAKLGDGRCAGLNGGGGVCLVKPKPTRKLGQDCEGDLGTIGYNFCAPKDSKGNDVRCSVGVDNNAQRLCRIACDATKSIANNSDCEKAGMKGAFCLPANDRDPALGACHAKCEYKNRTKCDCPYGLCRNHALGAQGNCKEADCKKLGGSCVEKTCIINVCI